MVQMLRRCEFVILVCHAYVNCILISFVIIVSVRKEELWNRLQSHGGQEAVVLEGEVAVPVGGELQGLRGLLLD